MKNLGKMDVFSMLELKSWETSIFGISGGMPKPMKNLGKTDVFFHVGAEQMENIHFWDWWWHA